LAAALLTPAIFSYNIIRLARLRRVGARGARGSGPPVVLGLAVRMKGVG
jgi:hypothetical protein